MANNPYVNKVQKADGTVLIDLTSDTVTANVLLSGATAHSASGASITGSIASKSSSDLSVSGDTVTVPAGYYASQASASVSSGSITNNTSGGTSSGTINRGNQIKVGAGYYPNDLYYTAQSNSGTYTVSSSGTKTVNGYYYASVGSCTVTNNTTLPSGSSSSGTINSGSYIKIGPGYNDSIKYYKAENSSVTLTSVTITPSEEETETIASPGYAYNNVTVEAIPSTYVGSGVTKKSETTYNVSSSAQTISSGTYLTGTQTIRAVTTSNITAANIKDGTTIKVGDAGSSTRIKNVTGTFTDASTVSSGQTAATASKILSGYSAWVDGSEVKGSISSKSAATYTPGTSNQTISSGQYLSGTQTISGDSNLKAANIKSGVSIFGVSGSYSGDTVNVTAGSWTTKINTSGWASRVYSPSSGSGSSKTVYATFDLTPGTSGTGTGTVKVLANDSASSTGATTILQMAVSSSASGWSNNKNTITVKLGSYTLATYTLSGP